MEAATFQEALHHRGPDPTDGREGETLVKISNSWSAWIPARAAAGDMQLIVEGISVQMKPPQITTNPPPLLPFPLLGNPPPRLYFFAFQQGPMLRPLPAGCGETKPLSETASPLLRGAFAWWQMPRRHSPQHPGGTAVPVPAALLDSWGGSAGEGLVLYWLLGLGWLFALARGLWKEFGEGGGGLRRSPGWHGPHGHPRHCEAWSRGSICNASSRRPFMPAPQLAPPKDFWPCKKKKKKNPEILN